MNKNSLIVVLALTGLSPVASNAILTPATSTGSPVKPVGGGTGPNVFVNTSTLIPNTVNGGNNTPAFYTGQCPWITSAMNTFCAASAGTWTYTWAAPTFNLTADLTVSDYYAWTVTSPNSANGFALGGGINNANIGGCDFGLTYNQAGGGAANAAKSPSSVFFIQAYVADRNGVVSGAALDNGGGASMTKVGAGAAPYYAGATSQTAAVSKMGDEPLKGTSTAPYYAQFQFQTVIAVDNVVRGVNNLTLYQGSEWWGYNYTATAPAAAGIGLVNDFPNFVAVPEPSTYVAGAMLLLPFAKSSLRRLRSLRKAA